MGMGAELGWFITMLEVSFSELRGFAWGQDWGLALSTELTHLSQASAGILITAIWQGVTVATCLALCLRMTPRLSAASRFAILVAGFLAVAALPFLPALASIATRRGAVGAITDAGVATATPWLTLDTRWSLALAGLWACASLWRLGDLALQTLHLRRLWKGARPVDTSLPVLSALPLASSLLHGPSLRGRKPVEICTTDALERPSVIGFLAPRILIPAWLLERMTPAELDQIVLHETEHLRRGDDWTNLLQKLALVLFPLNPALVWLERRLCLEREMACDEGVIRRTREPRAYAACLTSLAEHGLERRVQALSLGAWQRRPELVRRVHSILQHKPVLKPAAARGLVAVLGCGLLAGSAELARCPKVIGFVSAPAAAVQAKSQGASDALTASNADLAGDRVLRPEMQRVAAQTRSEMRPHMTELRATLPVRKNGGDVSGGSVALLRPTPQKLKSTASAPREELLKAEEPDTVQTAKSSPAGLSPTGNENGSDVAQDGGTQSWIVLTTWEQTDLPGEAAQQAAQSDTASADHSGDAPASSVKPARTGSQVTVTRLVFRVTQTPARDEHGDAPPPPQPTIVPVRGGWLIFRL
jgi:hypothetical protein